MVVGFTRTPNSDLDSIPIGQLILEDKISGSKSYIDPRLGYERGAIVLNTSKALKYLKEIQEYLKKKEIYSQSNIIEETISAIKNIKNLALEKKPIDELISGWENLLNCYQNLKFQLLKIKVAKN